MDNKSVTWQEVRYLIPLIGGIATIIFFLVNLSAKVESIQLQQIDAKTQLGQTTNTIDTIKTQQNIQGQDIAVIKQILQHNNLTIATTTPEGTLAYAYDPSSTTTDTSAQLAPTPVPRQTTTNTSTTLILAPTSTPSQPPGTDNNPIDPTPAPTPRPILCIGTLCI